MVMESPADVHRSQRLLDPAARISEILFGLIMALTFTTTLSAATGGREEVRTLLVGAIGCNIAWGLVDAVMFLMNSLTERGRELVTIRAIRTATTAQQLRRIITDAASPMMTALLTPQDFERVRQGVLDIPDVPSAPGLTRRDWLSALAVFLLVFLSTFPVVLPFLLFRNVQVAIRVSNLVAIAMLFAAGYLLARHGGYHPWRTGVSMVVLGVALVAITVGLGG
jgi:hypothetical protein